MGGLGKTKLASSLFNDGQVEDYFDKRIWICVSKDFSLQRLTSAMLDNLGEYNLPRELDTMQRRLRENVLGKRVLLVLDDVWKVNNLNCRAWEDAQKPFIFSNKTKIIVTTRGEEALKTILQPDEIYHLPYLSDDDCFEIFKYHAFTSWESDSDPILLELGEKISKKCKGLPLVAKILGRLLRGRDDINLWHDVLNSPSVCADDEDAMPILHLSYQYLPVVLKKCFRYCSVFPKGCQFNKKQLVNMWMANGFFHQSESNDVGEKYVNELISSSLLERDETDELFLKMHDMIHDLARNVSCEEWSSVECDVLHGNGNDGFQHLSIISAKNYPRKHVQQKLKSRSLLVFNSALIWPHVKDICEKLKNLRVLDMSHSGLPAILPELIGSLQHLRFLSLQGNAITMLPESMKKLHLLETLNLNGTKIEVLPDFICSLMRLQYLYLRGTPIKCLPESLGKLDRLLSLDLKFSKIDYLPDSISNLSCLRHLTCDDNVLFPVNMRKLNHLPIVKEITDVDGGRRTRPYNKEQIKVLSLIWTDWSSEKHKEMLELINDHHNVKQLCVEGFRGSSLASQLIDHIRYLNCVDFINCENLVSLSLENIQFLKHLLVGSARNLKYICMPMQLNANLTQSLTLLDCPNLTTISSLDDLIAVHGLQLTRCPEFHISCFGTCIYLQYLSIIQSYEGTHFYLGSPQPDTPELKDLSTLDRPNVISFSLSNGMDGHVHQCPQLPVLRLGDLSSIRHLCIKKSSHDIPDDFSDGRFQQLETLILESLPLWTSWTGPKEGQCLKLQRISIVNCGMVESFSLVHLDHIEELYVENCACLTLDYRMKKLLCIEKIYISEIHDVRLIMYGYEKFPHPMDKFARFRLWNVNEVYHLILVGCSQLEFVRTEDLPLEIEAIQIQDCKRIVDIDLNSQISLKHLNIRDCPCLLRLNCGSSMLRSLGINKYWETILCSICSLKDVEYLRVGGFKLKLLGVNLLLSSLKEMEIEVSHKIGSLTSMHPIEEEFQSMGLGGTIPSQKFDGLRKLRIYSRDSFQIAMMIGHGKRVSTKHIFPFLLTEFLNSLPSTLRVLEIIGPFSGYVSPLQLQGLNIQHLKLEDMPHGCCINFPSTLQVLKIIRCPMLNMFTFAMIECASQNEFEVPIPDTFGMFSFRSFTEHHLPSEFRGFPSRLRVLEIVESFCDGFGFHQLQGSNIQQLKLKDMKTICFHGNYVPLSLRKLCILRCPDMEYWCEQNKDKLTNVRIIYEEEDNLSAHATCSLVPFS